MNSKIDTLIRLAKAPDVVESMTGERPSRATIYRWEKHGLAGVRLRTAFAGGHRRTTERWIREFFDAVTAAKNGEEPMTQSATVRNSSSRATRIAAAERELRDAGI